MCDFITNTADTNYFYDVKVSRRMYVVHMQTQDTNSHKRGRLISNASAAPVPLAINWILRSVKYADDV